MLSRVHRPISIRSLSLSLTSFAAHRSFPVLPPQRPENCMDINKIQLLMRFKKGGAKIIEGSLSSHGSLVRAINQVDVVISALSSSDTSAIATQLQHKIVDAIKEAGNVKLPGCSSLLCDEFRELFPTTTKVKCLSDVGIFLDAIDVSDGWQHRWIFTRTTMLTFLRQPEGCIVSFSIVCDEKFFSKLTKEASEISGCFATRVRRLLHLHISTRNDQPLRIHQVQMLVEYATMNANAMRKILDKYDKCTALSMEENFIRGYEAKLQRRRQELTQTTPDQPVDDEAVYYKVAGDCPKGCLQSQVVMEKEENIRRS
ncbi:hypothetical protein Syun_017533 [Stephania yunnanensis]|uniref:NmrA-like domain-containing protein n=1 Tax=Stephania yunnanensis TaxID=152371 RepID=A0AAP0J743_9MAGN